MKLFFLVVMAAAATQAAPEQSHCNERCKDQKEGEGLVDACQRGCDLFLAKDAAERNIFVNPFTALQRTDSRAALIKCTNDCNLSYHDNEASSCADGCRWQSEVPSSRGPGTVLNFGDGGLTITLGAMPEMPRMPQGLSNLFSQVNDMVNDQIRVQHGRVQSILGNNNPPVVAKMDNASGGVGGGGMFGDMFTSMHRSMQDMMRGFLGPSYQEPEEVRDNEGKLVHGGGELVVIKSGPGYHSEKTYKLGPDADIEKILDNNMNDMLNDSIIEDTFEEQLKSEINMADILDKIPVDPVVVFGPDDEATLKEDSSSEDTLPVKVFQVIDPLSTDTVFEGSNYVDDYVEIENILDDERGIPEDEEVIENLPPVIKELMDKQERIVGQILKKENYDSLHPKITDMMANHISSMEEILMQDPLQILMEPSKFSGDILVNHKNPMEKYMNNDQVEVFGAPELTNDEAAEVVRVADSDPWGLINEGLEGPRLPETGLKSRHYETAGQDEEPRAGPTQEDILNKKIEEVFGSHHQPRFIYVNRDICAQQQSKLSWGDWFDCLHVRMGLPNWLLVSTVALGVIFTLWLCLVIPSNPPKQKVRTAKNVNVKELEANGAVATIIMPPTNELEKVDLPPSYDDLMITSELKKKVVDEEEDGFSAKLVLEDDEEIVEPLPQKANESNA